MMMNLHEIEEREYREFYAFGPRLWDANPDVCCAAYQLGACPHTEAFDPYDYDDIADLAEALGRDEREAAETAGHDDEPF